MITNNDYNNLGWNSGEEICKRLTSFPPRVVAIVLNLTLDDCDSRAFERNLVRLLYPYGIA